MRRLRAGATQIPGAVTITLEIGSRNLIPLPLTDLTVAAFTRIAWRRFIPLRLHGECRTGSEAILAQSDAPALTPAAPKQPARPELGPYVASAYELLRYATENSAQLPNDVLVAITSANESMTEKHTLANAEEETRFWNAYSLLASNKLADQARRKYRIALYVVLAVLLISQIYFVAGTLVVNRLTQVEDEWQGKASDPAGTNTNASGEQGIAPANPANGLATWQVLRRFGTSQANYYLGVRLVPGFSEVPVPDKLIPKGFDSVKANFMANYMKLRAELELILLSLSGYILPLLYGTLGAFAYVLRKLSDPVAKLNFANDTWTTYSFRIHIGALGGLAVGWFISGDQPSAGIGSLSPLALAFAAGYGSDLLFTLLDKVVGAFSAPAPMQSSVKSETTQRGGMTIKTETQREARVSGMAEPQLLPHAEETHGSSDAGPNRSVTPLHAAE